MTPTAKAEVVVAVRLPQSDVDRADALLGKTDHLPEFAIARVTRSAVLRLAILRGLDVLELEAKRRK